MNDQSALFDMVYAEKMKGSGLKFDFELWTSQQVLMDIQDLNKKNNLSFLQLIIKLILFVYMYRLPWRPSKLGFFTAGILLSRYSLLMYFSYIDVVP